MEIFLINNIHCLFSPSADPPESLFRSSSPLQTTISTVIPVDRGVGGFRGNLGDRMDTWAALWPLLNSIDELKAELAKGTEPTAQKTKVESSDRGVKGRRIFSAISSTINYEY